jgi:hypothetical protein
MAMSPCLRTLATIFLFASCSLFTLPSYADEFTLLDGRTLLGDLGEIDSLIDLAPAGAAGRRILFIDDQLRRTFISRRLIAPGGVRPAPHPAADETFRVHQIAARGPLEIPSVGAVTKLTPFNEFGRRAYTLNINDP